MVTKILTFHCYSGGRATLLMQIIILVNSCFIFMLQLTHAPLKVRTSCMKMPFLALRTATSCCVSHSSKCALYFNFDFFNSPMGFLKSYLLIHSCWNFCAAFLPSEGSSLSIQFSLCCSILNFLPISTFPPFRIVLRLHLPYCIITITSQITIPKIICQNQ